MTRQEITEIRKAIIAATIVRKTCDRTSRGFDHPDDILIEAFIRDGIRLADQFAEVAVKTQSER